MAGMGVNSVPHSVLNCGPSSHRTLVNDPFFFLCIISQLQLFLSPNKENDYVKRVFCCSAWNVKGTVIHCSTGIHNIMICNVFPSAFVIAQLCCHLQRRRVIQWWVTNSGTCFAFFPFWSYWHKRERGFSLITEVFIQGNLFGLYIWILERDQYFWLIISLWWRFWSVFVFAILNCF